MTTPVTLHWSNSQLTSHRDPDTRPSATADIVKVMGTGGRVLLRIAADGTVEGAIEDAGEAARIFVEEVRALAVAMGLRIAG